MVLPRVRLALVLALIACTLSFVAQSQPASRVARIGVLAAGGTAFQSGFEPFRQRLRELGYVEGRNLDLEVRNAEGRAERYPALAAELARLDVDVIVVHGNAAILALKRATQKVPIVMAMVGDPVGAGFVSSLAKPGGNITGFANYAEGISGKWLELLKEAASQTSRVGVLWDQNNVAHARMLRAIEEAGQPMGIGTFATHARGPDSIARAFSAMTAEKVDAVIVLPDPAFGASLQQIADLAAAQGLPAISVFREFPLAGGLMSYGPDFSDNWRRAAEYADKIVKGANPADLPVGQPVKFEMIINRKTEKALGLTLPASLLLRADETVE